MIKSRGMKWACMWHVWEREACRFVVRKHEGKRALQRPRHRWATNIKMGLRNIPQGL